MNLRKALDRWLATMGEDDGDSPLELAETAFRAGWRAARPPVKGISDGQLTHNADNRPGRLIVSLRGETDDGQEIRLTMNETAVLAFLAGVNRTAIGLDHPAVNRLLKERGALL